MSTGIQIHRPCGRSNVQVVVDFVCDRPYGEEFPYDMIRLALSGGNGKLYSNQEITQIVLKANTLLNQDHKKLLKNRYGVGYYLARPDEFEDFADDRTKRAINSEKKAVSAMVHTPLDLLPNEARVAHIQKAAMMSQMHLERKRQFRKLKRRAEVLSTPRAIEQSMTA